MPASEQALAELASPPAFSSGVVIPHSGGDVALPAEQPVPVQLVAEERVPYQLALEGIPPGVLARERLAWELGALDLTRMTPREAIDWLFEQQERLG